MERLTKDNEMLINMSHLKLFLLPLVLIGLPRGIAPEPLSPKNSLDTFKDGNHRICSQKPVLFVSGKMEERGVCLWFRKRGTHVIGLFALPATDSGICIAGKITQNIINGVAIDEVSSEVGQGLPLDNTETAQTPLMYWDDTHFLEIGDSFLIDVAYDKKVQQYGGQIFYRKAVLNLNGFYKYTAGESLPPIACD